MLIRELDSLRLQNQQSEDDQIKLLGTLDVTDKDIVEATNELNELRHAANQEDSVNFNFRKDIDFQE